MKIFRAGLNMTMEETDAFVPLVLADLANPQIRGYVV